MPRLARLDAPGALHHIIIRGIERRKIFRDNEKWCQILTGCCPNRIYETGSKIYD